MYLHEAVRKARKDLGMSQVKLAEKAGIQRKQLATLESGGNVTLATIRKVIGQLPNLEVFTLEGVQVDARTSPREKADELFSTAMTMLSDTFAALAARTREGRHPTPADLQAFRDANEVLSISNQMREWDVLQEELTASGTDMLALDPREAPAVLGKAEEPAAPKMPPPTDGRPKLTAAGFSPALARRIARRAKARRSAD